MKALLQALMLLNVLAHAQAYPIIGAPEHLYNSLTDLPEAPSGHNQFWESLRHGPDNPLAMVRNADGRLRVYADQWNQIWMGVEDYGNPDDALGLANATGIWTRDFYWQDGPSIQPISDSGLIRNHKVFVYPMSIFKEEGSGDLFQIMHIEDNRACSATPDVSHLHEPPVGYCYGSRYRIGLARCAAGSGDYPCETTGWQFLGVVIAPSFDSVTVGNVGGGPFRVSGGYLYVYYGEHIDPKSVAPGAYHQWISVARARIDSIQMQAAADMAGGSSTPWRKFRGFGVGGCSTSNAAAGNCWTLDPITGVGATLPITGMGWVSHSGNADSHTNLITSTVTGKSYMALNWPWGLVLHESVDGIQWGTVDTVSKDTGINYPVLMPVPTDRSSGDASLAGSQFNVVYNRRMPAWDAVCTPEPRCRQQNAMYRINVRLAPPNRAARIDYDGDLVSDLSSKGDAGYGRFWADFSSNGFNGLDVGLETSYIGSGSPAVGAPADYDGDGLTDFARKTEGGDWSINYAHDGFNYSDWVSYYMDGINDGWGDTLCVPVPADYDGDGKADLSVYCREDLRTWYIDYSGNGFNGVDVSVYRSPYFRQNTLPAPADYNGDGKADIAVYDRGGVWYVDYAPSWGGSWDYVAEWSANSYPLPGYYDADDSADFASFEPGHWLGGLWSALPSTGGSVERTGWGHVRYRPAPGDFDGDGRMDLAVKDDTTGNWYIDYSSNGFGATDTVFSGWDDGSNHALYKPQAPREEGKLVNSAGRVVFSFTLTEASPVRVVAYGMDGKRIATLYEGRLGAGTQAVSWNRSALAAQGLKRGIYFLKLNAGGFHAAKRLILPD